MQSKKILVAYATNSGTTARVAEAVGKELSRKGAEVDVLRVEQVTSVEPYAAVVVGGPMIMGWHRAAAGFVKKHQAALSRVPVAYFFTARSLTRTGEATIGGVPVCADPDLTKPPKVEGHLSFRERYATATNYLSPALKAAPTVKPVSAAFFGGVLDMSRLSWWQVLFVLVIIQAPPGGSHNMAFIKMWANNLFPKLFNGAAEPAAQNSNRVTA